MLNRRCCGSDVVDGRLVSCQRSATRQVMHEGQVQLRYCGQHAAEVTEETGRESGPIDWDFAAAQEAHGDW